MDDRTRPDTNVVLLRRKGDPSEAEREHVASTIFAEPDDIATFSRGNLVPPRPDTRDDAEEPAASPDPFFDRLQETTESEARTGQPGRRWRKHRRLLRSPRYSNPGGDEHNRGAGPSGQADAGKRTASGEALLDRAGTTVACAGDLTRRLWLYDRGPHCGVRDSPGSCPRPRSSRLPRSSLGSRRSANPGRRVPSSS